MYQYAVNHYEDILGITIAATFLVGFGLLYREVNPLAQVYLKFRPKRAVSGAVLIAISIALFTLTGCASLHDPAKPETAAQEFPLRNQDPRVGLIVNSGTAPMNLYVYDQANRLVEQTYMSGANRFITGQSGQPYPQYWVRKLEPGCYRVEAYPFYFAMVWIAMSKVRVDMPKQMYSICIGNNPTAYNYAGSNWGWLLQIGANIPDGSTNMPMFQINLPFN